VISGMWRTGHLPLITDHLLEANEAMASSTLS
jgi:hypothetical protein